MASDASPVDAMAPFAPGPLLTLRAGPLAVDVAAQAGGRIAQIRHEGRDLLVGPAPDAQAAIAWGSYPMVPWAGRIRRGRFMLDGVAYTLPVNLGDHAIHGVGFVLPWHIDAQGPTHVELSLALPEDERWPFGGTARQHIELEPAALRMTLSVSAGTRAMPVSLGWHPWFRKPERLDFSPGAMYPRDREGIAVRPLVAPNRGPWDDCFVNRQQVVMRSGGARIRLTSDCDHWVVFDELAHATCIEPQSGPPDAFNLAPVVLEPGQTLQRWFQMEWL